MNVSRYHCGLAFGIFILTFNKVTLLYNSCIPERFQRLGQSLIWLCQTRSCNLKVMKKSTFFLFAIGAHNQWGPLGSWVVCCLHLKKDFCSCTERRGGQWCGIFHYHSTASIKQRLLFFPCRICFLNWLSLFLSWIKTHPNTTGQFEKTMAVNHRYPKIKHAKHNFQVHLYWLPGYDTW